MKRFFVISAIMFFCFGFNTFAYTDELSYGIAVLRKEVSLNKTFSAGESFEFSPADFEKAIGVSNVGAISLKELPDRAEGTLFLYGKPVYSGQIIKRGALFGLSFLPAFDEVKTASFSFSDVGEGNGEYECVMTLS